MKGTITITDENGKVLLKTEFDDGQDEKCCPHCPRRCKSWPNYCIPDRYYYPVYPSPWWTTPQVWQPHVWYSGGTSGGTSGTTAGG